MASARDEISKSKLTELEMRDKLDLLQKHALEKCRKYTAHTAFRIAPRHFFIWGQNECAKASEAVVKQINELYELKYEGK